MLCSVQSFWVEKLIYIKCVCFSMIMTFSYITWSKASLLSQSSSLSEGLELNPHTTIALGSWECLSYISSKVDPDVSVQNVQKNILPRIFNKCYGSITNHITIFAKFGLKRSNTINQGQCSLRSYSCFFNCRAEMCVRSSLIPCL